MVCRGVLDATVDNPFEENASSDSLPLVRLKLSLPSESVNVNSEEVVVVQLGASQPNMDGYSLPASQLPYAIPAEAWPRTGPLPNYTTSMPGSIPNGVAYQQVRSQQTSGTCGKPVMLQRQQHLNKQVGDAQILLHARQIKRAPIDGVAELKLLVTQGSQCNGCIRSLYPSQFAGVEQLIDTSACVLEK